MAGTVTATVAVLVAVAVAGTVVHGEDLRNVIITGFGEMPYEPAPGWRPGGFYQSDVLPANVLGDDGLPQTMDVALRTRILVEDPNEKKTTDDGTENNSAEDGVKSSSQVSERNNTLDQDKAKEIEEELLSARTRWGLMKLKTQRNAKDNSKPSQPAPKSSITISQYRPEKNSYPHSDPSGSDGYNNREYYGDLGEGWNLEDAEVILGGRNYNVLTQNPNGYNPNHLPPPLPPPRELPPPRFPFYPYPGFGYKPFPPPPSYGPPGRGGRSGPRGSDAPRLREEVVYGRRGDAVQQPSSRWDSSPPRVYPYYDDYLSGA